MAGSGCWMSPTPKMSKASIPGAATAAVSPPPSATVRKILTAKSALGLFEHPIPEVQRTITGVREHRATALQAAREGIVLLKNDGPYDGVEVVQLYIRDEYGFVTRPVKELKAFRRVDIPAGETAEVVFDVTPEMLQCWGTSGKWTVEPGDFTLLVGSSSRDADLQSVPFTVTRNS